MYYMTEVDVHYCTNQLHVGGELLLVVAPVGGNTAYSDMLHCVHGGRDCTILSTGN